MKVPPKRKGNPLHTLSCRNSFFRLNESPSEKEGKFRAADSPQRAREGLNESPSEKEGKSVPPLSAAAVQGCLNESPSEKEGKSKDFCGGGGRCHAGLNESPSEKEGKYCACLSLELELVASMKVPPKRKGNPILPSASPKVEKPQ